MSLTWHSSASLKLPVDKVVSSSSVRGQGRPCPYVHCLLPAGLELVRSARLAWSVGIEGMPQPSPAGVYVLSNFTWFHRGYVSTTGCGGLGSGSCQESALLGS